MSFTFQWPRFSDQFHSDAIQMLNNALNKGNKPPVIADKIEVVELEMGTQPPELEIRDIGDLTMDQFRGIFRLTYAGDAHLVLKTKVQANPLNHKQPDIHLMTGSRGMLAAKEPLVVPMLLRLSHFKLNSYVVLVVSKQKGITLVFKTDPLQNVDINSTFDSIAVIQNFIQREIEGQLRQMFREDLPVIIHRLSQQWVKAKVEAPYLDKRSQSVVRRPFDTASTLDLPHISNGLYGPGYAVLPSLPASSLDGASVTGSTRRRVQPARSTPVVPLPSEPAGSLPDLENFDPTYGLRPDGLPTKSIFSNFGRLFRQDKGLADLMEERSEIDEEEEGEEGEGERESSSVSDWDDTFTDLSPPASLAPGEFVRGYQVPPRTSSLPYGASRVPFTHRPTFSYNPYFPEALAHSSPERQRTHSEPAHDVLPSRAWRGYRPVTPDSLETQFSLSSSSGLAHSIETAASTDPPLSPPSHESVPKPPSTSFRRLSISSSAANLDPFLSGSPPSHYAMSEPDPKIILRPTLNNTLHQLSTLSHSNHTLSPYTRSMEHFAVRSGPPRPLNTSGVRPPPERRPVKAKRKRTYHIGRKSQSPPNSEIDDHPTRTSAPSPVPPSEFDHFEIDQYFRSGDATHGLVGESGSSGHDRQQLFTADSVPHAPSSVVSGHSRDPYATLRQRHR